MWEFRNKNVFGATVFGSYGGFWIGLGLWVLLVERNAPAAPALKAVYAAQVPKDLGSILLGFAIFNTYMLLISTQTNLAIFSALLLLEATEITLFIGFFIGSTGNGQPAVPRCRHRAHRLVRLGGRCGEWPWGPGQDSGRRPAHQLALYAVQLVARSAWRPVPEAQTSGTGSRFRGLARAVPSLRGTRTVPPAVPVPSLRGGRTVPPPPGRYRRRDGFRPHGQDGREQGVDQEEQRAHDRRELTVQVARVKEKARPWKETIALVLAIAAAQVSLNSATIFQGYGIPPASIKLIKYALAVIFCALTVTAVLGIAAKTRAFFEPRLGSAHAAVIRYALLLVGLIVTLFITLHLFGVAVQQLLVGTALTSVLLGIAAQQSLSNIFAGMVLLLSRPFRVGDAIQLRAGALGGQLQGVVTEIGITYIRLDTGDTVMSVPNSQVLAAAVGPIPHHPEEPAPSPAPEDPVTRPPGTGAHV